MGETQDFAAILDEMDAPKKRMLEALAKSRGIVSSACDAAQIPRSTFYLWCKSDEAFKSAVNDVQEIAIDFVEGQLFKLIEGSDTAATIFFMKTRAKSRGYIERTELTGADGGPVETAQKLTDDQFTQLLNAVNEKSNPG